YFCCVLGLPPTGWGSARGNPFRKVIGRRSLFLVRWPQVVAFKVLADGAVRFLGQVGGVPVNQLFELGGKYLPNADHAPGLVPVGGRSLFLSWHGGCIFTHRFNPLNRTSGTSGSISLPDSASILATLTILDNWIPLI